MNLREWAPFRRASNVGHASTSRNAEEPLFTLGWLCMVGTVLAAFVLAAYAAL